MDTDLFAVCLTQLHEFELHAFIGIHSSGLSRQCENLLSNACMDAHWQKISVTIMLFNRSFLHSMVYLLSALFVLFMMDFIAQQVFFLYHHQLE